MTTPRYSKRHYEDAAQIINTSTKCLCTLFDKEGIFSTDRFDRCDIVSAFVDLFAVDNPHTCCGHPIDTPFRFCHQTGKQHHFKVGFSRTRFLKACGIEIEKQDTRGVDLLEVR